MLDKKQAMCFYALSVPQHTHILGRDFLYFIHPPTSYSTALHVKGLSDAGLTGECENLGSSFMLSSLARNELLSPSKILSSAQTLR